MAGINPKFEKGPVSYQVVEAVKGGQLVEARASSKIGVAAAGSATVLGVAQTDAKPSVTTSGTDSDGNITFDLGQAVYTDYVAVLKVGEVPVTYAANCSFGVLLKAAASGQVTPWVSGTDSPGLIVGRCTEPGGVVIATKPTGLMRILNQN